MEKQQGIRKDDDDDNDAKKSVDYGEAGAIAEEVLSAIHTVTSYGGQSVVVNRLVDMTMLILPQLLHVLQV